MTLKVVACAFAAAVSLGGLYSTSADAAIARHGGTQTSSRHASVHHTKALRHSAAHRAQHGSSAAHRVSGAKKPGRGGAMSGMASWYAEGARTASGVRFNPNAMTAAHRTLPFGTRVLVTARATGRTVTVTINDRGPFVGGRVIDLSREAARQLGLGGVGRVDLTVLR
jgi:rare lipoprotein A